MQWNRNDALFEAELRKGYKWQLHVASQLEALGYSAISGAYVMRANIADARLFADTADITIGDHVVEVKSRNLSFTGPDDYPYDTVFIETVSSYDSRARKPALYACVSQLTGATIGLDAAKTRDSWTICKKWDSVRKIHVTNYVAPASLWQPLDAATLSSIGPPLTHVCQDGTISPGREQCTQEIGP